MEADSNTLMGFSVEDLAGAAKIMRVVLVREGMLVGNDEVLALKAGDELEVEIKV
jgi:hypothetical protein